MDSIRYNIQNYIRSGNTATREPVSTGVEPMVRRHQVSIDVSSVVGGAVPSHVTASIVVAASCGVRPRWLLFCVPGGSYGATYWDFRPPNRSGYSFAEHLVALGAVVVAMDSLGTGSSSRPQPPTEVTIDLIAGTNASALDAVRSQLREGTLVRGLGPAEIPVVGVGHSLGGFAVLAQQSATRAFDALAVLGASMQPFAGLPPQAYDRSLPMAERRSAIGRAVAPSAWGVPWEAAGPYLTLDRASFAAHFYGDDVPADVIAADLKDATAVPREAALDVLMPDRWPTIAASILCPVLLAFGNPDLSPDVDADARAFSCAAGVRMVRVPASAHCHNLAAGRRVLWDAIASWLREAVGPRR